MKDYVRACSNDVLRIALPIVLQIVLWIVFLSIALQSIEPFQLMFALSIVFTRAC